MKTLLRILLIAGIVAITVAATCAAVLYSNQHRIIAAVLRGVQQQTGVQIEPGSAHLEFRSHLVFVLDEPRVSTADHEIVSLSRIRAVVNYNSILFRRGLPLRALQLDRPILSVPFATQGWLLAYPAATAAGQERLVGSFPSKAECERARDNEIREKGIGAKTPQCLPAPGSRPGLTAGWARPTADSIRAALEVLAQISVITRRIQIEGLELNDRSGPLLEGATLTAFRTRHSPRLWNVVFDSNISYRPLAGMHAAANLKIGVGDGIPEHTVLKGQIWYWRMPLKGVSVGNVTISGRSHGQLSIAVRDDATLDGVTQIGLAQVVLASPDLSAPLQLGEFSLEARFNTSSERVVLSAATLRHEGERVAAAGGQILAPYTSNPTFGLSLEGIRVAWSDLLARIRHLKTVPQQVDALVAHLKSGRIEVSRASLDASLDTLKNIDPAALLRQLTVNAAIRDVSFAPPKDTELPPVSEAGCQLFFSKGVLSASQGGARLGNSQLSEVNAEIDLRQGLAAVPYKIALDADADMGELKAATMRVLDHYKIEQRDRLSGMSGQMRVELRASGILTKNAPTRPEQYSFRAEPRHLVFEVRGAPGPVAIETGAVLVEPDVIRISRLSASATGGNAEVDGDLRIGPGRVETRGITIDLHQMPIERWLGLAVDEDKLSASGLIGGRVVVTSDRAAGFLVNGKLVLGSGKIGFGFLRAPFVVGGATLTLDGHRLVLAMPDSRLENQAIDFKVSVNDLRDPTIRIDALAQNLDLEVMKFVRLPWSPPTEQHFFKTPVVGHVDAVKANLESFAMAGAKTDFSYNRGNWRVYNLSARAYEGSLKMELSGREQDDWMRIQPRVRSMNIAALILLNPKFKTPPLQGRLDLDADIWADTNNNFFSTMAGTLGIRVRDGVLNKFTLLSRLLGFIDLKNWLTAQVPDPRVAGLPFKKLSADFKGSDGVLYTDNLLVDGPVMDIIADGNLNVDQSTMDMTIGLIPFNTVSWLLSNIPLIGKNVAGGTESIISAYFRVSGPIADPKVRPAPITSVEELAKKIIGLPVNLIRPNTIK